MVELLLHLYVHLFVRIFDIHINQGARQTGKSFQKRPGFIAKSQTSIYNVSRFLVTSLGKLNHPKPVKDFIDRERDMLSL